MNVAAPRRSGNQVERKVKELRGSGLSETHLHLGATAALRKNLPLRDAIVLREARRFEAMQTPASLAAWADVRERLRGAVPESTFKIWLEPLRAVGAQGTTLYLAAPDLIRPWVERRYMSLLREALQAADSGYSKVEFIPTGEGPA